MSSLTIAPVTAAPGSTFAIVSYLVHGGTELAIVNAQFEASNATAVADAAEATGLPVTTIVVTHNDPDFYFGTAVLTDRFPQARVVASPQTVDIIARNNAGKQEVWNPQLGDQAPARIVVPDAVDGPLTVDGVELQLVGLAHDPDHTAVWIPSQQVVLGGVYLNEGGHLWLADSRAAFTRQLWKDALRDLQQRGATAIYPAHAVHPVPAEGFGPEVLQDSIDYLETVDVALREKGSTDEIVAAITDAYPDLAGAESVGMGVGVIRGEIPWETLDTFRGQGHHWIADFGDFAFDLDFTKPGELTFTGVRGEGMEGLTDTMPYEAHQVGADTYLVSWQENLGSRVTHLQDYASGIVYTRIAQPDGTFIQLQGTLRPAA